MSDPTKILANLNLATERLTTLVKTAGENSVELDFDDLDDAVDIALTEIDTLEEAATGEDEDEDDDEDEDEEEETKD